MQVGDLWVNPPTPSPDQQRLFGGLVGSGLLNTSPAPSGWF